MATEIIVAQVVGYLGSFSHAIIMWISFLSWYGFVYIGLALNFAIILIPFGVSMRELSNKLIKEDFLIIAYVIVQFLGCGLLITCAVFIIYRVARHRSNGGFKFSFRSFISKLRAKLLQSGLLPIANTLLLLDTLKIFRPHKKFDRWRELNIGFSSLLILRGMYEFYCYWLYYVSWKNFETYVENENLEGIYGYTKLFKRNFMAVSFDILILPITAVLGVYLMPLSRERTFYAVIWTLAISTIILTIEAYAFGRWYYEKSFNDVKLKKDFERKKNEAGKAFQLGIQEAKSYAKRMSEKITGN